MSVARSTRETFKFQTTADRQLPQDKRSTFHCRRMPTTVTVALKNLRDGDQAKIGSWMLIALATGLCGWENFCSEDGTPIEFQSLTAVRSEMRKSETIEACLQLGVPQMASRSSLDSLSAEDAAEIALAIMRGSELTDEDVKN